MTKKELIEIEEFLIDVEESDDKIEPIERLWRWVLHKYRTEGPKKLGDDFKSDL
jgi:hypothetical protein